MREWNLRSRSALYSSKFYSHSNSLSSQLPLVIQHVLALHHVFLLHLNTKTAKISNLWYSRWATPAKLLTKFKLCSTPKVETSLKNTRLKKELQQIKGFLWFVLGRAWYTFLILKYLTVISEIWRLSWEETLVCLMAPPSFFPPHLFPCPKSL